MSEDYKKIKEQAFTVAKSKQKILQEKLDRLKDLTFSIMARYLINKNKMSALIHSIKNNTTSTEYCTDIDLDSPEWKEDLIEENSIVTDSIRKLLHSKRALKAHTVLSKQLACEYQEVSELVKICEKEVNTPEEESQILTTASDLTNMNLQSYEKDLDNKLVIMRMSSSISPERREELQQFLYNELAEEEQRGDGDEFSPSLRQYFTEGFCEGMTTIVKEIQGKKDFTEKKWRKDIDDMLEIYTEKREAQYMYSLCPYAIIEQTLDGIVRNIEREERRVQEEQQAREEERQAREEEARRIEMRQQRHVPGGKVLITSAPPPSTTIVWGSGQCRPTELKSHKRPPSPDASNLSFSFAQNNDIEI